MRKPFLAGAVAGSLLLVAVPAASADEQIRAQAPNRYVNPDVTIDQGERLTFLNEDRVQHDVTATQTLDGKPLFSTPLLQQGQEDLVDGSQYLTTGSYAFVCSIHSNMKGTLTVSGAGTPVPRPGTGGGQTPADTTKPKLSMRITKATRTSVRLRFKSDEAASVVFVAKVGSKRVGRRTLKLKAAGTKTVSFKLKGVRRGARVVVSARATDAAGNIGKASARAKAR